MCERGAVDVFKLAAQWHAVGDTRDFHTGAVQHVGEVVGRGLPFNGRIGRQDHLAYAFIDHPLVKGLQADLGRPDAIDRRQVSHQHEIDAVEAPALLDCQHIGRGFHHADRRAVAFLVSAYFADLQFGEVAAAAAVAHPLHRVHQRCGERRGALTVALQQVQGHALG